MVDVEFQAFPKIARLNRHVVVTEKIDGTNACVVVHENGKVCYAQSRKRLITPDDDNFGFAKWVYEHNDDLARILGPGYHYGEWWGYKIGRGYGLDYRAFSLFNTKRWDWLRIASAREENNAPDALDCVPILAAGALGVAVPAALGHLRTHGSAARRGFKNPEGIVVYHSAANQLFKVTLENDEMSKGEAEALARREQ